MPFIKGFIQRAPIRKRPERTISMRWMSTSVLLVAGCVPLQPLPEEPTTKQVGSSPFNESRKATAFTKVNFAPPSPETAVRVELLRGKLNPEVGWRFNVTALGSADLEIFHVGLGNVYITEGLV